MPSQEGLNPIVGAMFRYVDQFNHYKVRFKFGEIDNEVMIARCTSMQYSLLLLEKMPILNLNIDLRVVIKFTL